MIGIEPALLLSAAAFWPLALAMLCVLPKLGPRMITALPLAPLPALAAAIYAPSGTEFGLPWLLLDGGIRLDDTRAVFLGGAAILWTLAGLYAARYLQNDQRAAGFALFWNLVLAGNVGVFIAADAATFYVSFALVSLMAYPLVIHDRKPASLRAGAVYIVLAVIGEVALFAAFLMGSAAAGGSILIADIRDTLAGPGTDPLILWLLIAGLGIKAGLMPLHIWLPVAHPAAPVPASAVLSGAIVKAGIFGLLAFLPWGTTWPISGTTLALMGFAGLFIAALLGAAQSNPKTVLAYSTVSQMGLIMGVCGVALATGLPAAALLPILALYALHHGLTKGALFLGVGMASVWPRNSRPFFLLLMGALALSLAGLPLTAGALAKAAVKGPAGEIGAALIGFSALTSGLVLARLMFTLPSATPDKNPPPAMMFAFLALVIAALSAPFVVYGQILGTDPDPTADLAKKIVEAWPLGLAVILAAAAAAVGMQAPRMPEGDLLEPLRRTALLAMAAFHAMSDTKASSDISTETDDAPPALTNIERIQAAFADRAATAVAFALISGGLFFALI